MQFLYPSFLWALLALAIPIIIHLFYFRRFKRVYFTNVKFLKEVKEETSARRKVRNLLVLLSRLFAIAMLVFAFAQPFIPQDTEVQKGDKSVSIFIDNSFSMDALSEDVPLVEKAKQRAREVVSAYSVEDRFQILTNDFEGRHQRLVSKEDALALIDEVETTPSVKEISKTLTRQLQALNTGKIENKTAYLISDFQKNITDFQNFSDTTMEVNLIPLQSVQEKNISIDTAYFDSPVQMLNQTNTLVIKVRNHSDEVAENVRLSLRHEGQTKPVGTLTIPPRASKTDTINITILRTGWHEAELTITDYPVQFDDTYYFSFNVAEEINTLVINETSGNKYLDAAFKGISYFKVTNQQSRSLDYAKFPTYQLIVMNGLINVSSGLASELKQYVNNGGNLLVFPGVNSNISSYKTFLNEFPANELVSLERTERSVSDVNTEEFIFKDVFENRSANLKLPVTKVNYKMTNFGGRGEERLLSYRDGSAFLSKYRKEQGNLYMCAAPLDEDQSNLVRNAEIFVPMLYKMAISTAKDNRIAYTIGKDEVIESNNAFAGTGEMKYKLKGKAEEFIPVQRAIGSKVVLGINNQISQAGFYNLYLNPTEKLDEFAFNFDRKESNLDYYNSADLANVAGDQIQIIEGTTAVDITQLIGERSRGIVLWRWFIIAVLIFLIIEALLLRFWKV
jgi:hypothetical protein